MTANYRNLGLFNDFDPDAEEVPVKRPAWQTPKDQQGIRALKACGRQYFTNGVFAIGDGETLREDKHWKAIHERTLGATDECIMFSAWVDSCIDWAKKKNTPRITMMFPNLIKYINNTDKATDWIARNYEAVMKSRKSSIIEKFQGDD